MNDTDIDQLAINTIRTLAIDAVQAANSGHPGAPMALAPLGYTLWNRIMDFDPQAPQWPGRDRFVLSNGHASMLQWAILHLAAVQDVKADGTLNGRLAVEMDDIRRFRQLHSKAPGHPEYHWVSGVEATTGPLGQGVATSVGMAIAQRWLASRYDRDDSRLFDYRIYAVCGDGCMMEGISSEAASFAGHLGLGNLCWIYDRNQITIDGSTDITFTEDVAERFRAYDWHVEHLSNANDIASIEQALRSFRDSQRSQPTLIVLDSTIGYGSPNKAGKASAHGEALGVEEVKLTKRAYGWPEDAQFLVPDGVRESFAEGIGARGARAHGEWRERYSTYANAYPELAHEIDLMQRGDLPEGWDAKLPTFEADAKGIAGREASGKVLNTLAQAIPWILGGAADLESSTKVVLKFEGAGTQQAVTPQGRGIHYGVREHAMGAAVNGMTLSKLRGYGGTFFVFSDYQRPAIRMAALMNLPALFIYTHDALGDGEDGPTHQPVEHLASLRAMPNITVVRPGDANEAVEAYRKVLPQRDRPSVLVFSRQAVPTLDRTKYAAAAGTARGAYVIADPPQGEPQLILIASGTELSLAVDAHEQLAAQGILTRVVSMPCWDWFEAQPQDYQDSVLPPSLSKRLAIEQASPFGWERWIGRKGRVVGMSGFGSSAPVKDLQEFFGFTAAHVIDEARKLLNV